MPQLTAKLAANCTTEYPTIRGAILSADCSTKQPAFCCTFMSTDDTAQYPALDRTDNAADWRTHRTANVYSRCTPHDTAFLATQCIPESTAVIAAKYTAVVGSLDAALGTAKCAT